uniref:Uncharacterized protein n=1 Tax=Panagrolaimus sp. ES5 TaxID=591445 RepID=A0AC34F3N3_9BILA
MGKHHFINYLPKLAELYFPENVEKAVTNEVHHRCRMMAAGTLVENGVVDLTAEEEPHKNDEEEEQAKNVESYNFDEQNYDNEIETQTDSSLPPESNAEEKDDEIQHFNEVEVAEDQIPVRAIPCDREMKARNSES